mmetsp:Transcript_4284/g.18279  ORF Transcript_4284/g.18279 Transcript_4284/m.18279 type:complete len:86 (+) Transcript_4284:3783-4040(+)
MRVHLKKRTRNILMLVAYLLCHIGLYRQLLIRSKTKRVAQIAEDHPASALTLATVEKYYGNTPPTRWGVDSLLVNSLPPIVQRTD